MPVDTDWLAKHRKRRRRCAKTLKGKALICIDAILSNSASDEPLLGLLYRLAHCATGVCLNPHKKWVAEVNDTYDKIDKGEI